MLSHVFFISMYPVVVDSVSEDSSTVEGECTIHIALALAFKTGPLFHTFAFDTYFNAYAESRQNFKK